GDAVDIERVARERSLDLHLRWVNHIGLGNLEFGELLELVGERGEARLYAGILAQANESGRMTFGGNLIVEKGTDTLKDSRAGVMENDLVILGKLVSSKA